MRPESPHPAELALPDRPLLSPVGRTELLVAVLAIAAALYLLPAAKAWLHAEADAVQTSALGRCDMPTEPGEQLLVVVQQRHNRLVLADCIRVGSKGTYARPKPQRR